MSKGVMFSAQDSLPKLHVPPIDQTLGKYLLAVRPLVDEEQYRHTQRVVEDFRISPGPQLQAILEKRAAERTNWLSDWWKDAAYLSERSPLPIYSNPLLLFEKQSYTDKDGQIRHAAKLTAGMIDFKEKIDQRVLPVDVLGGRALCMDQYDTFFGGCRIPGKEKDTLVLHPSTRHVSVMHNNQVFSMDAYDADGVPLCEEDLYRKLKMVVEMSREVAPEIGVLTMLDRTSWAKTYNKLASDKSNMAAMADLQSSLFLLCLDGPGKPGSPSDHVLLGIQQLMHGDGAGWQSGNRWFDKTIQLIVGENGLYGFNNEHSSLEGSTIATLADHLCAYCDKISSSVQGSSSSTKPRKLHFNYSDDVLGDIHDAKKEVHDMVSDLDITVLVYKDYGKDYPKSQKLSPDGYIQVAIQLAYFKLHGKPCSTYETGSLRLFQLGRTDTIRSCTTESHNFTKAMVDSSTPREVKVELFKKAVLAHRNNSSQVVQGNGVDRHLLGWKLAALEAGMETPALYKDKTFSTAFHFNLSTSQADLINFYATAFGPVVQDGYGLLYHPRASEINLSVSAYNSCPSTDSKKMTNSLEKAFKDIKDLLDEDAKM